MQSYDFTSASADVVDAAVDAARDAAAVQFEALRVILAAFDDEEDCVELMKDAVAQYVVTFNRSMRQRVREYLDARGDDAAADNAADADYAAYQQKRAAWGAYLDDRARD
jgi:hypothetical protein